jgi:hypothetical protein
MTRELVAAGGDPSGSANWPGGALKKKLTRSRLARRQGCRPCTRSATAREWFEAKRDAWAPSYTKRSSPAWKPMCFAGSDNERQRVQTSLWGLDGIVNTIYSPPPLLIEHNLSSKSSIVKSRHVIRTNRPMKGLVAFVRAAAMGLQGACDASLHQVYPMSCRFNQSLGGWQLDRNEDRMHPGEGSA